MDRDAYAKYLMGYLRPCPFCGNKAVVFTTPGGATVECVSYNAGWHAVRVSAGSEAEAVAIWNGRRARE